MQSFILGAGMTGLAAGMASGLPIYEAAEFPGGICSSYYIRPDDNKRRNNTPDDEEAYRFEIGGGHWIFGSNSLILKFISSYTPVKSYIRKSAVFLPDKEIFVPYPIQNHLRYLDKEITVRALSEIAESARFNHQIVTLADWLKVNFGHTLYELFFEPFHELYTAGLYKYIAPQDAYKSPVNLSLVIQGAFDRVSAIGYNTTFVYPEQGLNALAQRMASFSKIHFGKRVVRIDVKDKIVYFEDGSELKYEVLISTLPLNETVEITGLSIDEKPDPFTSVLVINIGAIKGINCPEEHWVYVPKSTAGFHRVGFYSNVDLSFLPVSARKANDRVSIYIEKAYAGGQKPKDEQIESLCHNVVKELQDWGWIKEAEVVDSNWINVAYTWSWPGSKWREKALKGLAEHNIYQVGRFARWNFQGITDSIREGLMAGSTVIRIT